MAIYLPNVPEYPIIFCGVGFTGGVATTVTPLYTAEELERQLHDTQASYLVTSPPFLDKAKTASKAQGKIKKIFVLGGEDSDDCEALSHLLEDDGSSFPAGCTVGKDDVVTMPYSSGTTGLPKGVMITHHNMIASACSVEHAEVFAVNEGSVVMTILPFYHIYAQLILMGVGFHQGCKLVLLQRFEPEPFLKALQDQKVTAIAESPIPISCCELSKGLLFLYSITIQVTHAPITPPIVLFLAKNPMVDKYDLTSVEDAISGGAPLGEGLQEALRKRMPQLQHIRQCKHESPLVYL